MNRYGTGTWWGSGNVVVGGRGGAVVTLWDPDSRPKWSRYIMSMEKIICSHNASLYSEV